MTLQSIYAADLVLAFDHHEPNQIKILKNRTGQTGNFECIFNDKISALDMIKEWLDMVGQRRVLPLPPSIKWTGFKSCEINGEMYEYFKMQNVEIADVV